jgi:vacuolar-type H+-ATPase subunit C/Vma6
MTTMNNTKKDYCVCKAFENLRRESEKRNMDQHIQNLRQMNQDQDFDRKIKESEYQKTIRLLRLMKGAL